MADQVADSGYLEVEKIIRKCTRSGVTWYLIKWSGYTEVDNTWEPADNLACDELIRDFEERKRLKKKRRARIVGVKVKRTKCATKRSNANASGSQSSSSISPRTGSSTGTPTVKTEPDSECSSRTDDPGSSRWNGLGRKSEHDTKSIRSEDATAESGIPERIDVGFGVGWEVEAVESIVHKRDEDQIYYIINWKNRDYCSLVPSKICQKKIPLMICEYLQTRIPLATIPREEVNKMKGFLPEHIIDALAL